MKERDVDLLRDETDRDMEEIESLYSRMFVDGDGPRGMCREIHPEVKSHLHKKILNEIETLREAQRKSAFGSRRYWELDRRLRARMLKEIQIIIDAYVVARQGDRLEEWKSMYGDIEHYKRDFFYFRMDRDYEKLEKMLQDYKIIEE